MKVRDLGDYDLVVIRGHVGWVQRYRDGLGLITSTDTIRVDEEDEVRYAMSSKGAQDLLRALATPGSGVTRADAMTLRELAAVLRLSLRMVHRIIARASGSIEPVEGPRELERHEYMGAFVVGDELVIADRRHIDRTERPLACVLPAVAGTWHVYIRHEILYRDITVGMLAVHEAQLDRAGEDGEEIGVVAVDSGFAAIVDARARAYAELFREHRAWHEGLVEDIGCLASTIAGDGLYPVSAHQQDGKAVAVRTRLDVTTGR